MKVVITKASDDNYEKYVEIKTLEQLVNLIKRTDNDVIISFDPQIMPEAFKEPAELRLNIYDDYIE